MPFNNEPTDWDDLRLFLVVATEGNLSKAAAISGTSAPTLSRKMSRLEAQLNLSLFERHSSGFTLTAHGHSLLNRVREMDAQSQSIKTWRANLDPRPIVRIAAGSWTSVFLANNILNYTDPVSGPRIELLTGAQFLNLSRREADIAIRNRTPEQQGFRRKRIGSVGFAIYGSPEYCRNNPLAVTEERYTACDWIVPSVAGGSGSSSYWLRSRIGDRARLVCATSHAVLEASAIGAGLCVLPCFVGSSDPRLQQCSDPIESLRHTQWLASLDEIGKQTHARKVMRGLAAVFEENVRLFEGGNLADH